MRALSVGSTLCCLIVFAHGAGAQPLPAQQTALTGLTSVRVELLLIGEDLSIGLVERDLTEAVEDRLRRAGLAVRASDDNGVRGNQSFFRNQMGVTGAWNDEPRESDQFYTRCSTGLRRPLPRKSWEHRCPANVKNRDMSAARRGRPERCLHLGLGSRSYTRRLR